ncbi:MAG: lipid-A-disaccharide synthase [Flavobacteriaceae bacterium]
MKYYIISGEASGDLYGSLLIKALKSFDKKAKFRAWGGDLMKKEGSIVVKHHQELAFMGFADIFLNISKIIKYIKFCKKDIKKFNPDTIIYIDYPGFNLRIAKWAKKKGFKNHYYISPKIWAWKEWRIKQMKKNLDAIYVILEFEKKFFEKKHNFPVHFVGHPQLDIQKNFIANTLFKKKYNLNQEKIIALLPGSRLEEINKILPVFIKVAKKFNGYQFVIAGARGISIDKYDSFIENSNIKIIYNQTYDLLNCSTFALVASGTATLEAALFNIPQIVCYKTKAINYWIARKFVKVKYVSLVNLILNKESLVELIQKELNFENLTLSLNNLIKKRELENIKNDYIKLKLMLGKPGASNRTARLIFNSIKSN